MTPENSKNQINRFDIDRCPEMCLSIEHSRVREKHFVNNSIVRRRLCTACEDPRDFFSEESLVKNDSSAMKKIKGKKVMRPRPESMAISENLQNISKKITKAMALAKGRGTESALSHLRNDLYGVLEEITRMQERMDFVRLNAKAVNT